MTKIKIALCQMAVVDNKQTNIEKVASMIESISDDADIIVLPEMFICPYSNEKFMQYCEEEKNSPTLCEISKIARDKNTYILSGSIPEKENDKLYNTCYLFDKTGEIIAKHRKMHLFDIEVKDKISFKESDVLSPGDSVTICDTDFGKIGIGICYDVRFPELSRLMAQEGAVILIYPGAFNLTTGPAHWELLFKSRALDNQVFSVGVAPALDMDADYNSYGHSIVCSPWGEVVCQLGSDEEVKIVEIDLDEVKKVRQEIPVLKNKRNDLYETRLIDF